MATMRRGFSGAVLGVPGTALWARAAPMKIVKVETIYWPSREDAEFWPHWTWVRLTTDTGLTAVGETYPRNPVEAEMAHAQFAKALLGRDPRDIEWLWADFYRQIDVHWKTTLVLA